MECQYAVFAHHRHDVGSDADGTKVEQRYELREGYAVVLGKCLHELESHAAAAEILERVGAVLALGVEYGHCLWQFVVGHVVVADDEVNAQLLGVADFLDGLNAAVEHDNQFHAVLCRQVESLLADAVAFFVAVGDIVLQVGVELLQELVDQCHGGASVHVVVAIYHDALFAPHGVVQTVYGHVHVVHQEGVYEFAQHWPEESLRRRLCAYAPLQQQFGQHRTHPNLVGQFLSRLLSLWCGLFVIPFKVHYILFFDFLMKGVASAPSVPGTRSPAPACRGSRQCVPSVCTGARIGTAPRLGRVR